MRKIGEFFIISILIVLGVLIAGGLFASVRFFLGGNEDAWICENGTWVKHGYPSQSQPAKGCGEQATKETVKEEKTAKILTYFNNSQKAGISNECSAVYGTERTLPQNTPEAVLKELFKGPSDKEVEMGYTSPFSEKTQDILNKVNIVDQVAYIDLKDIRKIIPNVSSSCGSSEFLSEVAETLKQNNRIEKTIFAIEENPQLFYDWIQIGCSKESNNCDPAPFKQ